MREINELILIGRNIRRLRQLKGWKQRDLSEKAGLSEAVNGFRSLSKIENGRQGVSERQLEKIAGAL